MNVLSLFDGMSCGRIALDKSGIAIGKYFASEIDKHAIAVSQSNWDDIIHIGDVTKISYKDGILYTENGEYACEIDMVIGGSPCQSFSALGNGLGLKGSSGLFFEYLRILKEVNPKYFLLENVTMKDVWQDFISDCVGVQPILIDSKLVSAQNRARLYWTNIHVQRPPTDRHIVLSDILEPREYEYKPASVKLYGGHRQTYLITGKSGCLTTKIHNPNGIGRIFLLKEPNKHHSTKPFDYTRIYRLTQSEFEKLQTVPVGYTKSASYGQACKMIGNGWTVDVISYIFDFIKSTPNPEPTFNSQKQLLDFSE